MKLKTTLFFLTIFSLTACGQTNSDRTNLGIEYAKTELKDALTNKKEKLILVDKVITDKETAISISETILFKIYGRNNIIKQRPYEVNKIDDYWILNGTLPKKMLGGTFLIIINSTNGQIIKLTHGK
jgi:NTF2 fold immunity protein